MSLNHFRFAVLMFCLQITVAGYAQSRSVTAADYARAEKFMPYNTTPLVLHVPGRPTWLPDDRFWYRVTTENGNELVVIDPVKGTRGPWTDTPPRGDPRSVTSPNGKRAAFIRNYNLWARDVATGRETQLTKNGVKDFGYAADNAG